MKKRFVVLIAVLTVILSIIICECVILPWVNPLRRDDEQVREYFLELVPIGTSMDTATEIIEDNEKWKLFATFHEFGYFVHLEKDWATVYDQNETDWEMVGVSCMEVFIGKYSGLFSTSVIALLGFDEDGNLIDVAIKRYVDGL